MGEHDSALFARLAGLGKTAAPYPHQIEALQHLRERKSVLLHAPTGSGKSEAAFVPFLALRDCPKFPSRLLYALPMRTLVDSLADRFQRMAERSAVPIRVAAQHGHRPESVLLYADVAVATIDQLITSYACAPLSLGVRHGNIPAGAVAGSFLVFDEVHTFDPERALQSVLLIVDRLRQMMVPFVIMTATLPKSARERLCQRLKLTEIEVDEDSIPVRANRQVTLHLNLDRQLTADEVRRALEASSGRVLVVCNTVDRAVALYRALQGVRPEPLLLHSRFLDDDRKARDQRIQQLLGKNGQKPSLVIATQVVEVGLDISCDLLLTELCPIDALLQRAGRCGRWAEAPGQVRVYGLPKDDQRELTAPYDAQIVQDTARALEKFDGSRLTWALEQQLVDQVLGERYAAWLEPERARTAAYKLASAAFTGDRRAAEAAVREADSVEVSLHTQPDSLKGRLRFLPRISVSAGLVRRFAAQHPDSIWSVEVDRSMTGDESRGIEVLERVRRPRDIRFGHVYILSSDVSYSEETGLVFREGPGQDWQPDVPAARTDPPGGRPLLETMEQHLKAALKYFREIVLSREGYALRRVAGLVGLPVSEVEKLLAIALLCHDLGKASEAWQLAAWQTVHLWLKEDPKNIDRLTSEERQLLDGDTSATLLARFPSLANRSREPSRPAHATVSAYVMWEFLKGNWGNWGKAAALAMAHHHSVRASQVPAYRLTPACLPLLRGLLKTEADVELTGSDAEYMRAQRSTTVLPMTMPPFHQEKPYTLYLVLSRCLSLSDRMAAGGGQDAILDYEKWAGNL